MRRLLLAILMIGVSALAGYFVVTSPFLSQQTTSNPTSSVVVIEMTTRQWRFDIISVSPSGSVEFSSNPPTGEFANTTIIVHKGETIILHIKSLDVTHGFGLTEFGINVVTPPGEVTTVTFVASISGRFTFFCTVFCGTGHPNHRGTLVVVGGFGA